MFEYDDEDQIPNIPISHEKKDASNFTNVGPNQPKSIATHESLSQDIELLKAQLIKGKAALKYE